MIRKPVTEILYFSDKTILVYCYGDFFMCMVQLGVMGPISLRPAINKSLKLDQEGKIEY